ncbi:hypothetical protein TTHT_0685 [Thermotomaculum hydrothermale]|uniref:Uncharacterized protein n=1 Tax=Thermotomaculum hydrothermale TaxID=981385 RepID=A0A7R6PLF1_9BACT|nr:hypothetical protein [Thermotomaculum hydrothermale]BBB32257.1 hypothetical protein TTHT_0685 [Thermotomaculum hydrothermale]
MNEAEKRNIPVEKVVGVVLNLINPVFIIIVMIVIKDKIHSLVGSDVIQGVGYIFSGFTILVPFFARRIYRKILNKKQAEMVVYVLFNMPLIFGFIYFLLGGYLRYSIGFAFVTAGYFLFAGNFVLDEGKDE